MKTYICYSCGTEALFEKAEDGTLILWEECNCGDFNTGPGEVQPIIPEYKCKELIDEEPRKFEPLYKSGKEPF